MACGAPHVVPGVTGPGEVFAGLRPGYDVVLADPPWNFASNSAQRPGRNARRHYPCMSVAQICALPVRRVAASDAVLYLWTTAPFAELAFRVISAWGFRYKSQLVWPKDRVGTGYWARNRHELVYIARRGRFPVPRPAPHPDSVIFGRQREHSRKPDALHAQIEAAWPDARRLELFARTARPGWDVWGDQTDRFPAQEDSR